MTQYDVRRLPVIDGDRLVGMLSQADIALSDPDAAGRMVGPVVVASEQLRGLWPSRPPPTTAVRAIPWGEDADSAPGQDVRVRCSRARRCRSPRDAEAAARDRMNSTLVRAAALVAALLLAVTGCAPGTPDEDSWRYDATRAVGDVVSAVQTARLALKQSQEGRVHHAYLQAVLVDAERTGGMAAETLSSVQPPDVEHRRSSDVNDQLDEGDRAADRRPDRGGRSPHRRVRRPRRRSWNRRPRTCWNWSPRSSTRLRKPLRTTQ